MLDGIAWLGVEESMSCFLHDLSFLISSELIVIWVDRNAVKAYLIVSTNG